MLLLSGARFYRVEATRESFYGPYQPIDRQWAAGYPHGAKFDYSYDGAMRSVVFSEVSAADLAAALHLVMEMARRESRRYGNFWHGLHGGAERFAEDHAS